MRIRPTLLLLACGLAAACGQKGPLRLPDSRPVTAVRVPGPSAPAPAAQPVVDVPAAPADSQAPKRADDRDATPHP